VGFVDDLAQLLADTDIEAVLADFGKRTARQDPVVHFYETFLAAYDPKLRESRGVYYTPEPVVSYIVRSVDYLLKTRFGCANGLADTATVEYEREEVNGGKPKKVKATSPRVLILDPACGTATFLYTVIDHIRAEFMRQENAGMWSGYVRNHLLPRIFGFELLMAPYAVAHFKLGMQLAGQDMTPAQREKWAYDFSGDERLGVYLTNTLEEAERKAETLFGPLRVISQEANAALKIKSELPILAVIGNPPYSGHSANRSWEMKEGKRVPTFIGHLIQDYYSVDGQPLGEKNPKWLQDDYVKFIRWGQWRIERTGAGILAFITNHGYLDNPTFRGMRRALMNAFTEIYVLDLHGNSKKKERAPDGSPDENVFDIQQGVTLGIFLKEPSKAGTATVYHADLWGLREIKYQRLFETDVKATHWDNLKPQSPLYLFIPQENSLNTEYDDGLSLRESMLVNVLGFQTHRDSVAIGFTEKELAAQVTGFLGAPPSKTDWGSYHRACSYRPFDRRHVYLGKEVTDRPRLEVTTNLFKENVALNLVRQTKAKSWSHALVTRDATPAVFLEIKDGSSIFPLYCYHDPLDKLKAKEGESWIPLLPWPESTTGRRPNFNRNLTGHFDIFLGLQFVSDGKGDLKETFGPEDVFDYIYAVLHSPTYRTRYAEFLKSDFPRVPVTSDVKQFRVLCGLGAELVALHLLESPKLSEPIARYPLTGPNIVEKSFPKYLAPGEPEPGTGKPLKEGRVYISRSAAVPAATVAAMSSSPKTPVGTPALQNGQYFEGVPPEVWNFHIGGYQVCEKWLKDRRGRTLTYDDLEHYRKVVTALRETIRVMAEIDAAIPKWPIG
jgi:predicted helicase